MVDKEEYGEQHALKAEMRHVDSRVDVLGQGLAALQIRRVISESLTLDSGVQPLMPNYAHHQIL